MRRRRLLLRPLVAAGSALSLLLAASPAPAQETREQQAEKERAEKARQLRPYQRNRFEAMLFKIEDSFLVERIFNPPNGLFVRAGRITEGAGFGSGPAYRISNPDLSFTVSSAISVRKYWIVEASLLAPRLADRRAFVELYGRRRDFPQEDFFGIGPASRFEDRSDFALRDSAVNGGGGVYITPWLTAGGRVEYLSPSIGRGTDSRFPSTDLIFTDATAPGLLAQPDFIRTEAYLDLNYGDPLTYPKSGGHYTLTFNRYSDRDLDRYSFRRLELDARQYVPFFHRHRVLALRTVLSLSDPDTGHEVPFYLQRTLGGAYSLRGFRSFRFRDRNAMLMQAEYRYQINPLVTGALFYEVGKVARHPSDLDFNDLERDYGLSLRIGGRYSVAVRADVAFGSGEGTRIVVRWDNAF